MEPAGKNAPCTALALDKDSLFQLANDIVGEDPAENIGPSGRQPNHHLPASMTISPQATPAKIERRVSMKAANPAATDP